MRLIAAMALAYSVWLTACSESSGPNLAGLPNCSGSTLLTVSPMSYGDINEIAPLGNLNPPGHVFPTDHIYLYPVIGPAVPVVSPGKIRVTQALLQKRTGNGQPEFDDYGLDFYPCTAQHFYFGHLASLSATLSAKIGNLGGSCNPPYMTGGYTFQQCRKDVSVDLNAGDTIGTAGGPNEGALDLGLIDADMPALAFVDAARVNSNTLHAACPVDRFVAAVAESLTTRFSVNTVHRSVPPQCGTVMQDVANTPQGRWYFDATTSEDHHLALVHQNYDPTVGAFSIGTMVPGTTPTVLIFDPVDTGRVNRDFNLVTADGKIYCYEPTNLSGHLFVKLNSNTQVQIEIVTATAACGDSTVWGFTGNAATFAR